MSCLTEDQARAVFAVLAKTCGAEPGSSGHGEEEFVRYLTEEHDSHEFRFCGKLGFGGKLYFTGERLYVGCYREDETPATKRMITVANKKLAALGIISRG